MVATINGTVADGFEAVAEAFATSQSHHPGGAQLSVLQEGRTVVDLWTGADEARSSELTGDTPFVLWSTTKGMIALIAAMLVEQGTLDVDAPVSGYWPEFASRGKDRTTAAHMLTHAAGLPFFPTSAHIGSRDLPDWDRCIAALVGAEPLWEPGTASWYHPFTYGYLNGEVIRRLAGTTASTFFEENVARPLGIDFWLGGVPANRDHEVAHRTSLNQFTGPSPAEAWPVHGVDMGDPVVAELLRELESIPDMIEFLNTPTGHSFEFGGAGGVASARSVAKVYAACIGSVDGVRLISAETLEFVSRPRTRGLGPIPQLASLPAEKPVEWGLGFWLGSQFTNGLFASGGTFGHPGAGGIVGFAHPETKLAVAYTCTGIWQDTAVPDPRMAWSEPLARIANA